MPRPVLLLVLAASLAATLPAAPISPPSAWPEVTPTAKPWTRWWWPGSAVDEPNLARQLAEFAAAGLGGVEITPIYGALGAEPRYVDFLSPRWMELLRHTGTEARRHGLGVDMATGTGWPFGGPWVAPEDGSHRLAWENGRLAGRPTKMLVKRAAPGGEGLVIDPYSTAAIGRYLAPFTRAFAGFPAGLVRGQFHDSFEYYHAEWSPGLAPAFQRLHGYDLEGFAAQLVGQAPMPEDQLARLKADYRATLAQMHLDYLREWVRWSHERGFLVRNQSHGAPANLLDLYGTVDIPETETFGSTPFPILGLRRHPADIRTDQDLPEPLVMRLASSAAHVMGRPLASSETCTWLREHWKVALSHAKPEIDRLFANGINHVVYHGTVYSPDDAPWPGWLFYASTQFNPRNPWWHDFAALNGYVTRVQSVLQAGRPDNDILLYWPFADVIDDPQGLMTQFGVHHVGWLTASPCGHLARELMTRGFAFDFISDAQLQDTRAEGGAFVAPGGGRYRLLIVPATDRMPVETLQRIVTLARGGAAVLFATLPKDVPGLGRLEERRARFRSLVAETEALSRDPRFALQIGDSARPLGPDFTAGGVVREPLADTGLEFTRRATDTGHDYFIANLTARKHDGWIALGRPARAVLIFDPLTGHRGLAASREAPGGVTEVYLQLEPGESLIIRTRTDRPVSSDLAPWAYAAPAAAPRTLDGEWQVSALRGGPELPPAFAQTGFGSWTAQGGAWERFGGTARYRLEFDLPAGPADDWLLDLGDLRDSARVRLNGTEIATAWSLPFRVRLGPAVKPGRNVLELDVTNLAANRIRDLDRRGVTWRIMREINFVNIRYQPFDASNWALEPSGLLGPVTLTPLTATTP